WKWDMTLTFDKTNSTITKLDVPAYQTGPGSVFYIREGESYGTMYGAKYVKSLDQMAKQLPEGEDILNYVVNNEGYVIKSGTQATIDELPIVVEDENGTPASLKIGDINPDFRMGITSTLSYKNFSFYTMWKWKNGGDIYNKTAQNMVRDNRLAVMDQYGKKPEDMKTIRYYNAFYGGSNPSEYWVEDGSYLRLGEASLSYNLNKNNLGALGEYLSSINMSLIGKNLLTFTNYSGFDPEVMSSGYVYDNTGYPNFRTYSFSIAIKF
ncbi:MAG: hypothetical protein KAH32_07805, partial [Chlamydiia bacterium]|nr:hypothetical protein [Chlamydiia bacterium]